MDVGEKITWVTPTTVIILATGQNKNVIVTTRLDETFSIIESWGKQWSHNKYITITFWFTQKLAMHERMTNQFTLFDCDDVSNSAANFIVFFLLRIMIDLCQPFWALHLSVGTTGVDRGQVVDIRSASASHVLHGHVHVEWRAILQLACVARPMSGCFVSILCTYLRTLRHDCYSQ